MATVKRGGEEQPEINLRLYFTHMAFDLKLALLLIASAIAFIYIPFLSGTLIRIALGILMILLIPGYSLIALLFPGKTDLGKVERIALSFGLSIAISSLLGLMLNYTPWGIKIDPLVVCISGFSAICILLANGRRNVLPDTSKFSLSMTDIFRAVKKEALPESVSRLDRMLSIFLIVVVILSIGATIFVLSVPKHGERFTEFYILSSTGQTDNYPTQFLLGESQPIVVGVVNHEFSNMTYDLVVLLNNSERSTQLHSATISLIDEGKWEQTIDIKPAMTGEDMRLDFLLYRDGNMTVPYRELHLWINTTDAEYGYISSRSA